MRRSLIPLLLLLAPLALAVAPPSASANDQQLSIMMDDDHLLYRSDATRDDTLRRMQALGVDYVRVSVLWNVVAERARKGKNRKRFKPEDPSTYPAGNWDRYDRLVRSANRIGIRLYFNVTGPGPRWAMGKPPKRARKFADTWQPNGRQWSKFVTAVGKRYSGTYNDENDNGAVLPRISFWSVYNEPNQPGWLTPQWKNGVAWSPVLYRSLWQRGRAALDSTGHGQDVVLIGETAPLGNSNTNDGSPMYPKRFIREFLCLDSSNKPYTGAAAKKRQCGGIDDLDLRYTAWAHHPYTKKLAPTKRSAGRDSITMANVAELGGLLEQAKAAGRKLPAQTLTAMTEFGYESNPPDPFSGVSLAKQADYITVGDWLAYKDPSVIANTQFLLRDVELIKKFKKKDKRRYFTYQSGLYTAANKPKPAAIAYRFPFLVTAKTGSTTSVWGQTRFLPLNTPVGVTVEYKAAGQSAWAPVAAAQTNGQGFFTADVPSGAAGTYRATFTEPISGTVIHSREIPVS